MNKNSIFAIPFGAKVAKKLHISPLTKSKVKLLLQFQSHNKTSANQCRRISFPTHSTNTLPLSLCLSQTHTPFKCKLFIYLMLKLFH